MAELIPPPGFPPKVNKISVQVHIFNFERKVNFLEMLNFLKLIQFLEAFGIVSPQHSAKVDPEIKHEGVFHRMSIEDVLRQFKVSSVEKGLDSKEAEALLILNGKNVLPASKSTLYNSIIRCFFNGFGPLVWFGCIFSFLLYQPFGGANPVRYFWRSVRFEHVLGV